MKTKFLRFFSFMMLFLSILSFSSKAQDLAADRVALVNFYNATGGASWTNNTNWNTAATVDTWFGVTVSGGRVTEVSLPNNNLTGATSISLSNSLSALIKLNLSGNQLSGTIPYLSNANLQELNLSNNMLTGTIPNYCNFNGILTFNLSSNQFTGSLNSQNFGSIHFFDVSNNQFSGSLPGFGTANIESINVSHNQFTGSIYYFSNPPLLKVFNLSYNMFSGVLPYLSLPAVTDLNVSHNNLSGSLNYYSFPNIVSLDFSSNKFKGDIPYYSGTNYTTLIIDSNKYTFQQIEPIVGAAPTNKTYAPQDTVIQLHFNGGKLKVSAGGTLAKNTYKWYLSGGVLQGTTAGDSTFTPIQTGTYYVNVTNSVATQLTLKSNDLVVNTLPIKLLSFKTSISGNASKLEWVSSSEQNFNRYDVQRSEDGSTWKSIGEVKSQAINGSSNSQLNYSFYDDAKGLTGTVYYRLNQVDNDGTSEYSKVVSLKLDLATTSDHISVYPNPSKGNDISVVLPSSNTVTQLKVIDMLGHELRSVKVAKDTTQGKLNLVGLTAGIYKVIWVDGSGNVEQTTLVVN